ncbi:MAG: tRNA-intron lyase [Nanoarchaeota archaeon]|nr:tRNA-intron lyase [Nanoarchaeota archaeon]
MPKKQIVNGMMLKERIVTECSDESREIYDKGRFGEPLEDGRLQLNLTEAQYLVEKEKLMLVDGRNQGIVPDKLLKKAIRLEPNFWVRYQVYRDLRDRGYIVKTALKFGADFRVYGRGVKPGEDHAKWLIYPVKEGDTLTWYEFAAKNRVAHSTKKRLMIGIVDAEGDVTYYEIRWMRP